MHAALGGQKEGVKVGALGVLFDVLFQVVLGGGGYIILFYH